MTQMMRTYEALYAAEKSQRFCGGVDASRC
jgi:hypothetical protein